MRKAGLQLGPRDLGLQRARAQVDVVEEVLQRRLGQVGQQQAADRRAISRQPAAHPERISEHPLHLRAHQVKDVGVVQDGQRRCLLDARAQRVEDRLGKRHQRCRREIRMAQVQHARAQRELTALLANVAELLQRVQAAPYRCARELGALCHLGDGKRALTLGEGFEHAQAARQRQHEIRVAGKTVEKVGLRTGDADSGGRCLARAAGIGGVHVGECARVVR